MTDGNLYNNSYKLMCKQNFYSKIIKFKENQCEINQNRQNNALLPISHKNKHTAIIMKFIIKVNRYKCGLAFSI